MGRRLARHSQKRKDGRSAHPTLWRFGIGGALLAAPTWELPSRAREQAERAGAEHGAGLCHLRLRLSAGDVVAIKLSEDHVAPVVVA
jgi:hypothetical protein